jgi:hypothetical protein
VVMFTLGIARTMFGRVVRGGDALGKFDGFPPGGLV